MTVNDAEAIEAVIRKFQAKLAREALNRSTNLAA